MISTELKTLEQLQKQKQQAHYENIIENRIFRTFLVQDLYLVLFRQDRQY